MRGRVIVFITNSLWDEPHRGRHHFADVLATDNTVVWVNRRLPWRSSGSRIGAEHVERGLHVLHTGKDLFPKRLRDLSGRGQQFRLDLLQRALKENGWAPDLVWIYDYRAIEYARHFHPHCKVIYFCNDYFGEDAYRRYESTLAREVDCVLCTAPKLRDRFAPLNANCHFVPHGVWLPESRPAFIPKDRPETAGYVGTFRQVIDAGFFRRVLDETDLRLILGGPITECTPAYRRGFESIFAHPRVTYLGNLSRDQAAQALAEMDICLLPYVCTFQTAHQFTLKFVEYLAAGRPTVATPYFEWPEPYGQFVRVCGETDNLRDCLNDAYSSWDRARFDSALALAADATWEKRAEQVGDIVGLE